MKPRLIVALALVLAAVPPPAGASEIRTVSAGGPILVLNGIAAFQLEAAVLPLGIPAPAGEATFALQSTFEPPGPHVVHVTLWCAQVSGNGPGGMRLDASGTDQTDQQFHVSVMDTLPLPSVSWSRTGGPGPCGAQPYGGTPFLGPAVFAP